jgi:hypothetical protein
MEKKFDIGLVYGLIYSQKVPIKKEFGYRQSALANFLP